MKRASKEVVGWKQFKLFESNVKSNIQKAHSIFFGKDAVYAIGFRCPCKPRPGKATESTKHCRQTYLQHQQVRSYYSNSRKLHWLPVRHRINFKILLITFKVIHGVAREYLGELLTYKNKCNYNLRSTSEILLQQHRIKTLRTLGDRSFAVAAPKLWNNLPNAIRSARSINSFKKLLNTHLFKIAFDL